MDKNVAAQTEPAEVALIGLYEEYHDKIVRYIFIRIGDQAEAEDLAGETFLRALKSLKQRHSDLEHRTPCEPVWAIHAIL
jgi:DNA-directed RNA polymerase specialized sigma24 family protein